MIKIAVTGVTGRMGRNLVSATLEDPESTLVGAVTRKNNPLVGKDVGELAGVSQCYVLVGSDLADSKDEFDVVIDFTTPAHSLETLKKCADWSKPVVIGTTGFSDVELKEIEKYAEKVPVLLSYNTSLGINLLLDLLATSAKALGQEGYDIEVIEAHHRNKVDAPSGTAIMLGEALTKAMNTTLTDRGVFQRVGACGPRSPGEVGFSVVRAGDIVGEHTVIFATEGERIEITHKATSRMTFAKGAVKAARWLSLQRQGLYNMNDVLSL